MEYQTKNTGEMLFLTKKQVKKKIHTLFKQIDDNKDFSDYDNIEMKKQVLDRFYQEHHHQISRSTMLELHKWLIADNDMIDTVLLGIGTGVMSSFIATGIIEMSGFNPIVMFLLFVIGLITIAISVINFTKDMIKTMRSYETVYVNPHHAKLLERYMHRKRITARKKLTGRSQHESRNKTTN